MSDIDKADKKALVEHIDSCEECRNTFKEMDVYFSLIEEFKNTEFELINSDDFTKQVINQIEINTNTPSSFNKVIQLSLKIAAAILIFVITGFYFNQKSYINNSIAELQENYKVIPEKQEFVQEYNACRSSSEILLKEIITTNDELLAVIEKEAQYAHTVSLKRYSANVCGQSTTEFVNASTDEKKEILKQFLKDRI